MFFIASVNQIIAGMPGSSKDKHKVSRSSFVGALSMRNSRPASCIALPQSIAIPIAMLCLAVTPSRNEAAQNQTAILFQHGAWRCKDTRHGLMVFSHRHEDLVSVSLDYLGQYSETEVRLFRALIKPGDTVVDVGANIGGLSLPLARMVQGGRVHAFEPRAETASFLRANMALNGLLENVVVVHEIGAGSRSDVLDLITLEGNSGASYLETKSEETRERPWGNGRRREVSNVRVAALDDLRLEGIERLKLLKVDAEGHDLSVLQVLFSSQCSSFALASVDFESEFPTQ